MHAIIEEQIRKFLLHCQIFSDFFHWIIFTMTKSNSIFVGNSQLNLLPEGERFYLRILQAKILAGSHQGQEIHIKDQIISIKLTLLI